MPVLDAVLLSFIICEEDRRDQEEATVATWAVLVWPLPVTNQDTGITGGAHLAADGIRRCTSCIRDIILVVFILCSRTAKGVSAVTTPWHELFPASVLHEHMAYPSSLYI